MFRLIKKLTRQQRHSVSAGGAFAERSPTPAAATETETPPVSQAVNDALRAAWKARQQGDQQKAEKAMRELRETIQGEE